MSSGLRGGKPENHLAILAMKSFQSKPRTDAVKPAVALSRTVSFTLAALAAWSQLPAQAQERVSTGALAPVVVSSSRFPNDPAFAPVAATVITADQIREAGIDNANEAIRKLGGVNGRQSTGSPNDFPLDMRGFGTNGDVNMVIMLDGVRVSENELATPLLSSIPIESIERIEIVRGGSSVLYGAGATGGVIQIITKRPQANAGYGSIVGELGSDGQRAGRFAVSRGWDNMAIDASYAKSNFDGYRDNNYGKQENFSTAVQWFDTDWRFGLRTNISRADWGLAGGLSQAQFDANPRQAATPLDYGSYDNDSITAFLERRFGSLDVAAELSHREKIARSYYDGPFGGHSTTNTRVTQFSPRIRHVLEAGRFKNEFVAGVDLSDWTSNSTGTDADPTQHSKALYLHNEIEIDKNARLSGGVRRELFKQASVLNGYDRTTGVNAWDLQASYAFVPNVRAFAKLGQSYRMATPDENGFARVPVSDVLKPQVSHDLELGTKLGGADRQLTVKWFRHRLHDEIYFDGVNYINTNLDPTRHEGVELEGRLRVSDTVMLSATYQYVQAKFTEGPYKDKELALVPKHMLQTRMNWKSGNQSADVGARWVDRQREGDDFENTCRKMPSYTTLDARYAVRVKAWEFAVSGTNLTNHNYYSQAYSCSGNVISGIYPDNGREFKVTARYDF